MGPEAGMAPSAGRGPISAAARARQRPLFLPSARGRAGHREIAIGNGSSASGAGTVYSVTVVHPRPPDEPYNVVLVDLAEGPRMMSRVVGR